MYVTCAPWSYAATSNAERVRVDDPPEQRDPAPRRRVEDDDLVRRHGEVLAADDRDQALEEVDPADDHHQAAGEADPPRPFRVPCHDAPLRVCLRLTLCAFA